jgi:RecA/RadA recombinase
MTKFNMDKLVSDVKKQFKDEKLSNKLGTGNKLKQLGEGDFLKMPQWWVEATNTPGLPYGAGVQFAGKTDSGKTSAALEAIKAAQEQEHAVIYIETENKTSERDLINKGIDPKQIAIIRTTVAEEAFDMLFELWDGVKNSYPDAPMLIVWDSFGNMVSQRDSELTMLDGKQKPGGKGSANRLGLSKLIAKMEQSSKVALFLVNYTYANLGSPGRTNAGGEALGMLSSLIYQTARRSWLEKTVKGEKVRIGAQVQWTLYKNHIYKDNPGPKQVLVNITSSGLEVVGKINSPDSSNEEE